MSTTPRRLMTKRRAGVLFEVLLSIAIFAGAAMFTLRVIGRGLERLDRVTRQAQALDLARTTMTKLEAGLIDLADLREGDVPNAEGDGTNRAATFHETADQPRWAIEARTRMTEYEGLTLVELTVREAQGERFGPADDGEASVSVTLRQFVRFTPLEIVPYEEDELVRDLVEPRGGTP